MKPSFYNISFEHKGKIYIYNTLTTALASIDEKTKALLCESDVNHIPQEIATSLQRQGFLVDDSLDEVAAYECYYNEAQYGGFNDELRIVFVPTYNCNLRCVYCFEDCHIHNSIQSAEIQQIVLFVKNQLNKGIYKKLSVVLFGGEPLSCTNQCIELCNSLSLVAREYGIEMHTKISTNALLVNTKVIEELFLPTNMRIQITMDGSRAFHDQRRIYSDGRGTYDKILESICLLNKYGIKDAIDLRINVDKNNINSLEEVLKDIYDKVGYIYIGLLRAVGNNLERVSDCISDNDYILKYRPVLEPLFNKYGKKLHYGDFGKKHACALNSGNSFIIDCNLDVYKCDNLIGQSQYSIGKITNGEIYKTAMYYKQRTWSPFKFEKCRKCHLLPACAASCAYLCLLKNGSMDIPLCAFTEEQLMGKIKQFLDRC
jgi:uncharacterized protein